METIVLDGQSLFDIAIQQCGTVEAAFSFAILNDIAVTDELKVGTVLATAPVQNRRIAEYYAMKSLAPATASGVSIFGGIGFMAIEQTFIVS